MTTQALTRILSFLLCLSVLSAIADSMAIRIAADAQPATRRAAAELQHYVRAATGRTLAITNVLEGDGFAYEPAEADYGPDGYRIVSDGSRLSIRANGIHGHLFGTYGYLKRFLGVQWFLSTYTNIPSCASFALPRKLDWTDVPAFELRDLCDYSIVRDLDFALHLRMHGRHFSGGFPPSVGGESFKMDSVLGNSHTFERILPPAKYFQLHPEWYAERDGNRREVDSQLCLSNPEVLERAIEFVIDRIRKNPKIKYFGVSQNDNQNFCTCAKCRAVDEEEGSHSGSIIRFVSAVAEAVEKVDPTVTITTLAYQYSFRPPKFARPRRNMVIVLCDIGADFSKPFGVSRAPYDIDFQKVISGWNALGAHLYLWDYTTNYRCYQDLFLNIDTLAPNLRYFRANGARQVYEEGANYGPHADSGELKTWMLAELMWNPDQDTDALRNAYVDGVYGKAAPYVREYYALRRELAKTRDEAKCPMGCFTYFGTFPIPESFFRRATALWTAAASAAKGNPVAERQCRLGLFSTDALRVMIALRTSTHPSFTLSRHGVAHAEDKAFGELLAAARRTDAFLRAEPNQRLTHGRHGHEDRMYRQLIHRLATRCDENGPQPRFEAGIWSMKVDEVPTYYRLVKDAGALDGEIVDMHPEYSMQGIKFFFSNASVEKGCGVRCRLRLKLRPIKGGDPEQVLIFGAIDAPGCADGRVTRSYVIRAKDVKTTDWAWYDIGTVPMVDAKSRVWLGVSGTHRKPVAEYMALDRLEVSLAE